MSAVRTARSLVVRPSSFLSTRTGPRSFVGVSGRAEKIRSRQGRSLFQVACLMVVSKKKLPRSPRAVVEIDSFWGYQSGVETD